MVHGVAPTHHFKLKFRFDLQSWAQFQQHLVKLNPKLGIEKPILSIHTTCQTQMQMYDA